MGYIYESEYEGKILGPYVEVWNEKYKVMEYTRQVLGRKLDIEDLWIWWCRDSYQLHSSTGCPHSYYSAKEAKEDLDRYLTQQKKCTLVSQEEFDKLNVLA